MITITVLGGSGFLGSNLSNFLSKKKKFRVIIFDKKKPFNLKKNQEFIGGSILNEKQLAKAFKKTDYVYNFAALSDLNEARDKPLETAKINILGTIKALLVARKFKIKKFIQASSIYANSEQGGFYGSSKKASEDYIEKFNKKFNLKFTILRFGSLYGNGADKNNGINIIIDQALKNNFLTYNGTKKAARRYIHIDDACRACMISMNKKYDNKYLNITGKNKIKITKLLENLSKIIGISNKKIFYKNFVNEGHYVNEPRKFIPRKGINLDLKKYQNFNDCLKKQYLERKNKFHL